MIKVDVLSRDQMRLGFIFALVTVAIVCSIGCTSDQPATLDFTEIATSTPTRSTIMPVSYKGILLPPTPNPTDPTPEVIGIEMHDAGRRPNGFTRLEHRIIESELIVRAELIEISDKTCRVSDPEHFSGWYPVIQYHFRVLEYLKGDGENQIVVNTSFGGDGFGVAWDWYRSNFDAKKAAQITIAGLDVDLLRLQSILFIEHDDVWRKHCVIEEVKDAMSYSFALDYDWVAPEFAINSDHNRVWLPIHVSSSQTVMSAENPIEETIDLDSSESRFRLSIDSDASTPRDEKFDMHGTITVAEFKHQINSIAVSESAFSGYADCLKNKNYLIQKELEADRRGGYLTYHWQPRFDVDIPDQHWEVYSGDLKGTWVLHSFDGELFAGSDAFSENVDVWLDGSDAAYFSLMRSGSELDPTGHTIIADGVMVAGSYHAVVHVERFLFEECGGYRQKRQFNVQLDASTDDGIVYEALYAVDSMEGRSAGQTMLIDLEPDRIGLLTIDRISWDVDELMVIFEKIQTLNETDAYEIEFINWETRSSVRVAIEEARFDGENASRLVWDSIDRAWSNDDRVLVRVWRRSAADNGD